MTEHPDSLVALAIITSRNEALVLASALEHAGIFVRIHGVEQASVFSFSVALVGHRLMVPAFQWEQASSVVREMGLPDGSVIYRGQRRAVLRFMSFWVGIHAAFLLPAVLAGLMPLGALGYLASLPFGVPVDPRGQNDWFLAEKA